MEYGFENGGYFDLLLIPRTDENWQEYDNLIFKFQAWEENVYRTAGDSGL